MHAVDMFTGTTCDNTANSHMQSTSAQLQVARLLLTPNQPVTEPHDVWCCCFVVSSSEMVDKADMHMMAKIGFHLAVVMAWMSDCSCWAC